MSRFGIQNYEPRWLNGRETVTAVHGQRLLDLTGQTLRNCWLVWDLADDEWFADAPVLLDFGTAQVEIDHQKFDDLSITWNTLDPAQEILDPHFNLAWRPEPLAQLVGLAGQMVNDVELLEWSGDDLASGSVAVSFTFSSGQLCVYNALDENALEREPLDLRWRQHRLA